VTGTLNMHYKLLSMTAIIVLVGPIPRRSAGPPSELIATVLR
jgi:hypothetical protein